MQISGVKMGQPINTPNEFFPPIVGHRFVSTHTRNALVQIDKELSILLLKWAPYSDTSDFQAAMLTTLELVKKYQIRHILHDAANLATLCAEAHNWLLTELVPQFKASGVRKVARVVRQDPVCLLISSKLESRMWSEFCQTGRFEYRLFAEYNAAYSWLNE